MNAINPLFNTSTAGATESAAPNSSKELGQEDFLKLLVAQLKNQDPNNPADNGEFLGQIAQFSMVSGIDDLGTSFKGVEGSLYTNQAMQAAQLVGKDVLVESDTVSVTEGDITIEGMMEFSDYAENASLQIRDEDGELLHSIELGNVDAGMQPFAWNGKDADELKLPEGEYQITASGLVEGELEVMPVHLFSSVESVSVDRTNTDVLLHFADDKSIPISQVREYR